MLVSKPELGTTAYGSIIILGLLIVEIIITVILGVLSCIYYSEEHKERRRYIAVGEEERAESDTNNETLGSLIDIPDEVISLGVISSF
jgi:hypothetical protein